MGFSESVSEQLAGREPCFRSSEYFDVFVEEARKKGYPEISRTRSPSGTGPAPLVGGCSDEGGVGLLEGEAGIFTEAFYIGMLLLAGEGIHTSGKGLEFLIDCPRASATIESNPEDNGIARLELTSPRPPRAMIGCIILPPLAKIRISGTCFSPQPKSGMYFCTLLRESIWS